MKAPSLMDKAVASGLVLALAGLFSGLTANTPLGSLKPFDILIMLITVPCFMSKNASQYRISAGLILMIIFYLVCTVPSCIENDFLYGLRRGIQVMILVSYGFVLLNVNFAALNRRHYLAALAVMSCIVAFNVGWHVANGFLTDWKRLGDPKSLFIFLPACVGVGIVLKVLPRNTFTGLVWALLCVLIMMSGERKALPAFFLISMAVYLDLRSLRGFALAVAAGLVVVMAADVILDGYVFRRVDSIFAGSDARNDPLYILQGGIPASLSDAQRKLGIQVATQLFHDNPIFGSGMESTANYARSHFANYPKFLTGVAHNEFWRVLAEHGIFGMVFMLIPIFRTLFLAVMDSVTFCRVYRQTFYPRCMIIILTPISAYMWSEGSGVEMFALVMLVALLPEIMPRIAARCLPPPAPAASETPIARRRPSRSVQNASRGLVAVSS
ncbi:O-antigen ligase family protein [Methylobacterium sp. J-070]|uniref:O-antigen ligase family protein n=1 Tax=Methylobacterium sp. J-070 TaxID=2836650 RepID=UPI001FBB9CB6|nr:O-antigen ligase family protein [Methylobacterium sp. J-070]MCJ2053875.1 O-antigen ligase family protein [Methylobacterium sp. J-070]